MDVLDAVQAIDARGQVGKRPGEDDVQTAKTGRFQERPAMVNADQESVSPDARMAAGHAPSVLLHNSHAACGPAPPAAIIMVEKDSPILDEERLHLSPERRFASAIPPATLHLLGFLGQRLRWRPGRAMGIFALRF